MHRILVVGDNTAEATALAERLGFARFEAAASSSEVALALRQLLTFRPDLIILDGAARANSRELFRLLESVSKLPIVVMGENSEEDEDELVWYLGEGASDYITKPAGINCLSARIRAVLRHVNHDEPGGVLRVGDLEVDLDRHEVHLKGRLIPLTPTEFRLLKILAERPGQLCSHRSLMRQVWGEEFADCTHYARLYIGYLRQKLEANPKRPQLLVTQWGVGYRLVEGRRRRAVTRARPVRTAPA